MKNIISTIYPFGYTWIDYPDNYSYSLIIYCLGCDNNCVDCQSPQLKDINSKDQNVKTFDLFSFEQEINKFLKQTRSSNIVLSGGDFLSKSNIDFTREFLKRNNSKYNVCIYTGHTIDYAKENNICGFKFIKCNKFNSEFPKASEKTDEYFQLASTNQELYDSEYKLLSNNGRYWFV